MVSMQMPGKVMTQAGPSVLCRATGTQNLEKTLMANEQMFDPLSECECGATGRGSHPGNE